MYSNALTSRNGAPIGAYPQVKGVVPTAGQRPFPPWLTQAHDSMMRRSIVATDIDAPTTHALLEPLAGPDSRGTHSPWPWLAREIGCW